MEQKLDDHTSRETYGTIVIMRETAACRRCRKPISMNELAIRQLTQSRGKQCCPQYYHLNGRCRMINSFIRSDLNVDRTLP